MYKIISAIAISFFIFVLWILYLANTKGNSVFFDFVGAIPYGDKVGHVGLFGFLTFVVILGTRFKSFYWNKFRIYYGAFGVISFVIIEEFTQLFIASRTFDFIDLAADSIGIFCAISIASLLNKKSKNTNK